MAGYIEFDLTTDEDALQQQALDRIAADFPGWQPNEGHLEVVLVEELARMNAETAQVAQDVAAAIFNAYGEKLVGVPRTLGAPAAALATFTAVDALGYTIPAGTVVGYRATGSDLWLFETINEAVITPGATAVANVPIRALEDGTQYNGIAASGNWELIDALAFIASVASTTTTSGGVNAETDDAYLARLAERLTTMAPRPILAADFAILAKQTAGVQRALAIDGYNPANATFNNERMVTLAAVDANGVAVSTTVRDAMLAALDAQREINFVVNGIDPTYSNIAIATTVVLQRGQTAATVSAAITAALTDYLNPARWGGGDEQPPVWRSGTAHVRYLEVAQVINAVAGVDYVSALTINGGTADVLLAGVAPLPQRVQAGGSTVAVTVA